MQTLRWFGECGSGDVGVRSLVDGGERRSFFDGSEEAIAGWGGGAIIGLWE